MASLWRGRGLLPVGFGGVFKAAGLLQCFQPAKGICVAFLEKPAPEDGLLADHHPFLGSIFPSVIQRPE